VETATQPPVNPDLYLPKGIVTHSSGAGIVNYYDLQGKLLGELQSPNLGTGLFQQAVIAGPLTYSPEPVLPLLVYFAPANGGEIWMNNNDEPSLLVAAPNLLNMVGVSGKSLLAYSLLEYMDYGLRTKLFLGDPQTLSTIQPILDNTNTESYAVKPLAISMDNEQPTGVWYTTVPYGIGGDIVFEPRKSLNYLDLSNNQINSYLDNTIGPAGISDDHTWVAYTPTGGVGPLSITKDFDFTNPISFPLKLDSDRGSGNAVFSPDNEYVAWKEASGSIMGESPTFHETIRIASTNGNILFEIADTSLVAISGFSEISWLTPVGWLDPQTVAIEVRGIDGDLACILSVNLDGSELTFIAPGSFIGFLYP
jgi:hypothetical protein